MRRAPLYAIAAACLLVCVAGGCGYTTTAYIGSSRTIYIAPFKNGINIASSKSENASYINYYPLLESTITDAVVDRFIFDGNLKVVKEKDADLIIRAELTSYSRGALRYAENNEDVTEYRVTVTANAELYDTKTQQAVWQDRSFSGDSTYYTTGTQAITEKDALDNAIADLARRFVESIVEAW